MAEKKIIDHIENNLTFCLAILGTYLAFCFQGFAKGFFFYFKKVIYLNLSDSTYFYLDLITRYAKKSFEDDQTLLRIMDILKTDLKLICIILLIHLFYFIYKNEMNFCCKAVRDKYFKSLRELIKNHGSKFVFILLVPQFPYVIFLSNAYLFIIPLILYEVIVISLMIHKKENADFLLKLYSVFLFLIFIVLAPVLSVKFGYSFAKESYENDFELFDMYSIKKKESSNSLIKGRVLLAKEDGVYVYDYQQKLILKLDQDYEKMDYISPMAY